MEKAFIILLKQHIVIEFLNTGDCNPLDIYAHLLAIYVYIMDISNIKWWVPRAKYSGKGIISQ